jgi:alkylated DNA repair dioxygenase AlkB
MSLFPPNSNDNILPYDGIVNYFGPILSQEEANHCYERILRESAWVHDEAILYGKHLTTKRKIAWYGDKQFDYHYSGTIKRALPWKESLLSLKEIIEYKLGVSFNSCLLNLYHNGDEGMAWHSDDEKSLGVNTIIASVSLGAERKFSFRHKTSNETISVYLEHGSLLLMQGATQTNWQHCLPKSKKVKEARINLTFRRFVELS